MVMSREQNAGQSHNIKTDNSYFQRVEQFKYLGTTIMNQFYFGKDSGRECLLSFSAESFVI
jgi:outer membrane protein W